MGDERAGGGPDKTSSTAGKPPEEARPPVCHGYGVVKNKSSSSTTLSSTPDKGTDSPQSSCNLSQSSGNVVSIVRLKYAGHDKLLSVCDFYNIEDVQIRNRLWNKSCHDYLLDTVVAQCSRLSENTFSNVPSINHNTYLCFGDKNQMLCDMAKLSELNHVIVLPKELSNIEVMLSFHDKIKLLIQWNQFRNSENNNIGAFLWNELARFQMLSVADFVEAPCKSTDKVASLRHSVSKCSKFKRFKNLKNVFSLVRFGFCLDDISDCISLSPELLEGDSEKNYVNIEEPYRSRDTLTFQHNKEHVQTFTVVAVSKEEKTPAKGEEANGNEEPNTSESERSISIGDRVDMEYDHVSSAEEVFVENDYDTISNTEAGIVETEVEPDDLSPIKKVLKRKKKKKTKKRVSSNSDCSDSLSQSPRGTIIGDSDDELELVFPPSDGCVDDDDICLVCKAECSQSQLQCYICKLKVHYCCYDSNGTAPMDMEAYETFKGENSARWFCKACKDVDIDDLLALVCSEGNKLIKKIKKKQALNKESICSAIQETIEASIKKQLNIQHSPNTGENFENQQPATYAKIADTPSNGNDSRSQVRSPQDHNNEPLSPRMCVEKTVIIGNVSKKAVIKSSSSMKGHFNAIDAFKRMPIDYIFKDQFGNIHIQLQNNKTAKFVVDQWKPEYLADAAIRRSGTTARMMNTKSTAHINREKAESLTAVVKHVPLGFGGQDYSNKFIGEELNYNQVGVDSVERFVMKRNGSDTPLRTVKVIFKNQEDFNHALENGVAIGNVIHKVEKLKNSRRVMQCFKCKGFGHPSYQCLNQPRCKYCGDTHKDDQCTHKDLHNNPFCCNCKGSHIATSALCPVYKERVQRRSMGTSHSHNGY